MTREIRCFKPVSDDGRNIEIIEYATVKREFNMHDGAYDVENKLRTLAPRTATPSRQPMSKAST